MSVFELFSRVEQSFKPVIGGKRIDVHQVNRYTSPLNVFVCCGDGNAKGQYKLLRYPRAFPVTRSIELDGKISESLDLSSESPVCLVTLEFDRLIRSVQPVNPTSFYHPFESNRDCGRL